MNLLEVMEFYEESTQDPSKPDFYIPLDKICGFSKFDDEYTLVYVQGITNPIRVKTNINILAENFDIKMRSGL